MPQELREKGKDLIFFSRLFGVSLRKKTIHIFLEVLFKCYKYVR